MARGFESIHPDQEQRLKPLGVTSQLVAQGWGITVKASAGTHNPVGKWGGRLFGLCVDLSSEYAMTRQRFDHLLAAGFMAFPRFGPKRQWKHYDEALGLNHTHLLDFSDLPTDEWGWLDSSGVFHRSESIPVPGWTRVQFCDACQGRNGLVGNGALPPKWAPTEAQLAKLRKWRDSGSDRVRPAEVFVDGKPLKCYAFHDGDVVRAQFSLLAPALGVVWAWDKGLKLSYKGQAISAESIRARHEGDFTRCDVRALAEACAYTVVWDASRAAVTVA